MYILIAGVMYMIKKDKRMIFKSVAEFRSNLKVALDFVAESEENDVAIYRTKEQRFLLFADSPESYADEANEHFKKEAEEAHG